jgi:hypothetical protein
VKCFHKTLTEFVLDNVTEPTILKPYFLDEKLCCRRLWCGYAREGSIPAQHQNQYERWLRISNKWGVMLWERKHITRQGGVLFTKNCTWTAYYRQEECALVASSTGWLNFMRIYFNMDSNTAGARGSVVVKVLSWKVAGSSPDEVDFLNWPNPSGRIMALGSTQRVDSASNRN